MPLEERSVKQYSTIIINALLIAVLTSLHRPASHTPWASSTRQGHRLFLSQELRAAIASLTRQRGGQNTGSHLRGRR